MGEVLKHYRLLDIDNCISDDGWRIPLIDWSQSDPDQRYHQYHLRAPYDIPGNRDLFERPDLKLVMVTSRPLAYRTMTTDWLHKVGCNFEHLLMRNDHDHRPTIDLKRWQVQMLIMHYGIPVEAILDAYDDRPEIVEMYRRDFGIEAHVRKLHDICAYINPHTGFNHAIGQPHA